MKSACQMVITAVLVLEWNEISMPNGYFCSFGFIMKGRMKCTHHDVVGGLGCKEVRSFKKIPSAIWCTVLGFKIEL